VRGKFHQDRSRGLDFDWPSIYQQTDKQTSVCPFSRSFWFIAFLSRYDVLTLMFNSYNVHIKVNSIKVAVIVSHSHLLQVLSKQPADMVSHSHLLLFFGANDFALFSLPFTPFCAKSVSLLSINSCVLIHILIGMVITGFSSHMAFDWG